MLVFYDFNFLCNYIQLELVSFLDHDGLDWVHAVVRPHHHHPHHGGEAAERQHHHAPDEQRVRGQRGISLLRLRRGCVLILNTGIVRDAILRRRLLSSLLVVK